MLWSPDLGAGVCQGLSEPVGALIALLLFKAILTELLVNLMLAFVGGIMVRLVGVCQHVGMRFSMFAILEHCIGSTVAEHCTSYLCLPLQMS